jgi:hypothetical protein
MNLLNESLRNKFYAALLKIGMNQAGMGTWMAGLEVGLETKAIQRLASSGGRLAVGGMPLSRQ